MGRRKRYADAAEKQRAYRARLAAETVRVNRRLWAALEARRDRMAAAVAAARDAGCPVAKEILGAHPDTILESLAAWFEGRATQRWPAEPEQGTDRRRPKPSGTSG